MRKTTPTHTTEKGQQGTLIPGGSGYTGFRRRSSVGRRGSGRTSIMKSALPEDVEDEALGVANTSVIEGNMLHILLCNHNQP